MIASIAAAHWDTLRSSSEDDASLVGWLSSNRSQGNCSHYGSTSTVAASDETADDVSLLAAVPSHEAMLAMQRALAEQEAMVRLLQDHLHLQHQYDGHVAPGSSKVQHEWP